MAVVLGVCMAGCYRVSDTFPPNRVYTVRLERAFRQPFEPQRQAELRKLMTDLFGGPDQPRVPAEVRSLGLFNDEWLAAAAGPVGSDKGGRSKGLFREHCAVCHGVSGDGVGPVAFVLKPYPRDFRRGLFKFKATPKGAKPTHEDLRRIIETGIPGTGMPSYRVLPAWEIDALAQYVTYLSVRGEVERGLIDYAAGELRPDQPIVDEDATDEEQATQRRVISDLVSTVARSWRQSESLVTPVRPPKSGRDRNASIARGRELFLGDVANCVKCHGPSALGDGQTTDYDDWAKEIDPTDSIALAEYCRSGALGPRPIQPRNLRLGIYHGGGRPEDLYRRIHNGIDGTPMPAALIKAPNSPPSTKGLTEDDIWCLVDYISSLPGTSETNSSP